MAQRRRSNKESGVNQWYLSNSHASMKEKQRFNQSGNDVVQYSVDWLRALVFWVLYERTLNQMVPKQILDAYSDL